MSFYFSCVCVFGSACSVDDRKNYVSAFDIDDVVKGIGKRENLYVDCRREMGVHTQALQT